MKPQLSIGLIGAGRIGRIHAANLAHRIPGASLRAVADVDRPAARSCADQYGASASYEDYRELLSSNEVDAVVVSSSTDTHADIVEAAAQAGKDVFCEKPISLDLQAIGRAMEAVRRAGVQLQVGYNRRFDPNFRRLRDAVRTGEIGTPHLLHIISRDPAPPPIEYVRRSGGLFVDMTIHDFDMARFLIGEEVVEVFAAAGVRVDPAIGEAGDVDTAIVTLKFEKGTIGTIDNSRQAVYGYDQRAEVFGSLGSIRTGNNFPNAAFVSGSSGIRRDPPLHFFVERYQESYVEELRAFIEAIRDEMPVPVTGEDGRASVVMGLAARRSYEENRPVRLQEIEAS
jgi:myo-inositol 2-dehydrogenase/D-chiro-inositol 1-dehydrogenase